MAFPPRYRRAGPPLSVAGPDLPEVPLRPGLHLTDPPYVNIVHFDMDPQNSK